MQGEVTFLHSGDFVTVPAHGKTKGGERSGDGANSDGTSDICNNFKRIIFSIL